MQEAYKEENPHSYIVQLQYVRCDLGYIEMFVTDNGMKLTEK